MSGTQSNDLRVIAEQTDDRTGQNGHRNAGSNDHDRTDDADVPGEFVGQIPTFCPQRLTDQRSGGVGKSVGGQNKEVLLSGWSDSEQPEESFPVLGNHGGQSHLAASQCQAFQQNRKADAPHLKKQRFLDAISAVKQRDLNQVDFLPVCTEESCQQKLGRGMRRWRWRHLPCQVPLPHMGMDMLPKENLADRIDQQVVADHIGGIGR